MKKIDDPKVPFGTEAHLKHILLDNDPAGDVSLTMTRRLEMLISERVLNAAQLPPLSSDGFGGSLARVQSSLWPVGMMASTMVFGLMLGVLISALTDNSSLFNAAKTETMQNETITTAMATPWSLYAQ